MSSATAPATSDANGTGYVKVPARVVEWLLLGALATGGGYAGSASADKTDALERQIERLERSVHEYHRDMERDLDEKIEREVELQVEREVTRALARQAAP
ncbi:MAG: hypothetical protein AAF211_06795 [Myxococcota bacterium]